MLPLFAMSHRDLQRYTKKKYFLWRRVLFVGLIVFMFIGNLASLRISQNTSMGQHIISSISWTLFWLIALLGPISSSQSVSEEIEKKTLGLLILTELDYKAIILGKYFQSFFLVLLNALAAFPVFFCTIALGGISGAQIIGVFFVLLGTLVVCTSIGIFTSTIMKTNRALSYAPVFCLLYFAIVFQQDYFSPYLALRDVLTGFNPNICYPNFLIQVIIAAVILKFSSYLLPKMYFKSFKTGTKKHLSFTLTPLKKKEGNNVGVSISGNPITWRDYYIVHKNSGNLGKIIILVCLFLFLLLFVQDNSLRDFIAVTSTYFFISLVLTVLLAMSCAIKSFTKEMNEKPWQLLLITSLSNSEILWGKIWAIGNIVLPYFTAAVLSGIAFIISTFMLKSIDSGRAIILLSFIIWGAAYIFDIFSLSLFCSFYYKTHHKASNWTIIYLVIWHFISALFITATFSKDEAIIFSNIVYTLIHIVIARCFLGYIKENLRTNMI